MDPNDPLSPLTPQRWLEQVKVREAFLFVPSGQKQGTIVTANRVAQLPDLLTSECSISTRVRPTTHDLEWIEGRCPSPAIRGITPCR